MPKYYCDYCDTYLTHDSPSVRKTHCGGRKHKENVCTYYQKWLEDQVQKLVDDTTAAFKAGKIPNNPYVGAPGAGGAMIPPPSGLQPPRPMPPPGAGIKPPGVLPPGAPMFMPGPMRPMGPMPGGMGPIMGPMGPMMPGMRPMGPMGGPPMGPMGGPMQMQPMMALRPMVGPPSQQHPNQQ